MPAARMLSLQCILLLVLPVGMAQTPPPASGDWTVKDSTVISNTTITLDGNLTVKSGGKLELYNVILIMDCDENGQYTIKVESGGDVVFNGTTVTCPTPDVYYKFQIYGDADITCSTIEKVWGEYSWLAGGVEIHSDNVSIVGSTIRWCTYNGITVNNSKPTISGCTITENGWRGISCCGNASPSIKGNTLSYTGRGITNFDSSSPTIVGNSIEDNGVCGIWNNHVSTPRIENNSIFNSGAYGIYNVINSRVWMENNTIYNNGYCGILNHDFSNATMISNTIYQNYGAGIENLYISNATIVNNTIYSNIECGIHNFDQCNAIISHNTIYDHTKNGIENVGQPNVAIANNNLTRNIIGIINYVTTESFLNITNNTIANTTEGIVNGNSTKSVIRNNTISDSYAWGIDCYDNSTSYIDHNIVTGSGFSGIILGGSANATITNNSILNNILNGIDCNSDSYVEMTNNTIAGNKARGVVASHQACLRMFRDNSISNNWMAISAIDTADVLAQNNTLEDNEYGIWVESDKAVFSYNFLSGGHYGFNLIGCSPPLEGNRILDSDCGIWFQDSNSLVSGATISNTRDYCIYCTASSSPLIVNSTLSTSTGGVALHAIDSSKPTALNTILKDAPVKLFDTSSFTIKWYLQLDVKDSMSRPLSPANISIDGPDTIRTVTDTEGTVGWLPLEEKTLRSGIEPTKAVYSITVDKDGDVNTFRNIMVNRSERRDLQFDFSPVVSQIPPLYLNEDAPFSLNLSDYIDDRDHSIEQLEVALAGDALFDPGVALNDKTVTFEYPLPEAGKSISFNVSDGTRNATGRFMVHVNETNDAPVLKDPGTLVIPEDELYNLDLGPYLSDEEDGIEDLKLELNSTYASLHGLEIVFCYPEGVLADQVLVTAMDRGGASCQRWLHVNVLPVNDPPRLGSIPEIWPVEDVELVVDLSGLIEDPDTDLANISARIDSRYGRVDGQRLVFNYPEGVPSDSFNLTLSDGLDNQTYSLQVQVRPVNDPPVLTIPTISVVAGESRTVDLSVLTSDPDTPMSQIQIRSISPHVSVNGFNITISYPKNTPSGIKNITLRLNDGMATNSITIPVNVTASRIKEKLVPASNLYLYLLLPLAIIGTAAGILLYRRKRYGWYRMRRAMLVNTDGRLLAHVGDLGDAEDELLVSSMLTAVQQFIEEVMKKEKAGAIKEFLYEDLKIAVERGQRIYLAVFIEGYATERLRRMMKAIVTEMEMKYSSELAHWDGRTTQESFITEAGARLKTLTDRK